MGQLSRAEDADYLARILSERRDIMARYWFSKTCPLDTFEISGNSLTFQDLAVGRGFLNAQDASYEVRVYEKKGKGKGKKLSASTLRTNVMPLDNVSSSIIMIRSLASGSSPSPWVLIDIADGQIQDIRHQD